MLILRRRFVLFAGKIGIDDAQQRRRVEYVIIAV
jgi:hypothetical protein